MSLCCQSEQTVAQTLDWPVIRDAMTVIWRRRYDECIHAHLNTSLIPMPMRQITCNTRFIPCLLISRFAQQPRCYDSKVHEANMRPIWGQQDPGQVGPMLAPWTLLSGLLWQTKKLDLYDILSKSSAVMAWKWYHDIYRFIWNAVFGQYLSCIIISKNWFKEGTFIIAFMADFRQFIHINVSFRPICSWLPIKCFNISVRLISQELKAPVITDPDYNVRVSSWGKCNPGPLY